MAYIVLLNPLILGASADITGAHLSPAQVTTATALAAAVMTVLMGLVGNAPLALAAGLGINGIVAFQMAPAMTWAQAFGLVVLEGVCIVLMAVSGVRERIMNAIPRPLKTAITVGIGLYIALVGLVSAGFVTRMPDAADSHGAGAPGQRRAPQRLADRGVLRRPAADDRADGAQGPGRGADQHRCRDGVRGGAARRLRRRRLGPAPTPALPDHVVAAPDFGLFGHIDLFGGFASAGALAATVFLFTLVLSGFFDAMGTITSVSDEAGLSKNGKVPRMGRILLVDGAGAIAGGVTGSSPNTVFLESAAGRRRGRPDGPRQRRHRAAVRRDAAVHPARRGRPGPGRGARAGGHRRHDGRPVPQHPVATTRTTRSRCS